MNGTLIGCEAGEIIFFEEKNNLYSKNFGIKIKKSYKYVFQTKSGEIAYSDGDDTNQIIFYNYLEKKEIANISDIEISQSDIFKIGMISKELLFVISEGKK